MTDTTHPTHTSPESAGALAWSLNGFLEAHGAQLLVRTYVQELADQAASGAMDLDVLRDAEARLCAAGAAAYTAGDWATETLARRSENVVAVTILRALELEVAPW